MNAIWTMIAVAIYVGGTLGPDGVVTGKVAFSALTLAILSQCGFMIIGKYRK